MCGITGFLSRRHGEAEALALVRSMAARLAHRGPDDAGAWCDAPAGVALGHRRLSIVDLSPLGHQPMVSGSGRYVLTSNSELYNFRELRGALDAGGAAIRWRSQSDTEVMLEAIAHWGLAAALERFVGMFAFALWDRERRVLHLARDRMGEKPLYYGWCGEGFVFGSELKALRAYPAWRGEIDRNALALYLRYGYVPAPFSIYRDVRKLPPGSYLSLAAADAPAGARAPEPVRYWRLDRVALAGRAGQLDCAPREAADRLDDLLRAAVRGQMLADVPLGAFLSGGVDSSSVVALMQAQSAVPVKTFTIGFEERGYNEADHALAVARHLGTDHTELYASPADAMQLIPGLPEVYDEPFADSSQIPTLLVSRLARRKVTVSLSGDGGDELFGGYTRYLWGERLWRVLGERPKWLRAALASLIRALPPHAWDAILRHGAPLLPRSVGQTGSGDKPYKLADILAADRPEALYQILVSLWRDVDELLADPPGAVPAASGKDLEGGAHGFIERMMYADAMTYLPDDILVKVDRATMSAGLESRVPLLDHRVVEFAWRIPLGMKIRGGRSKWLLREVLYRYVPPALIERPKMGFGVPIGDWLRGELRAWAEGLLDAARLRREGIFRPEAVRRKWDEHQSGRWNWQYQLWAILMFESWLDSQAR